MIVLISRNKALIQPFNDALPAGIPIVHVATPAEAQPYLPPATGNRPAAHLVCLEVPSGPDSAADFCRQCRRALPPHIPLIAIITRAADREAVLSAGADDYLLQPLIPAGIKARLAGHLCAAQQVAGDLLKAIQQTQTGQPAAHSLNLHLENLARLFGASAAWLLLWNPDRPDARLPGSYNLPPLLTRKAGLAAEAATCLSGLQTGQAGKPVVAGCPCLSQASPEESNGLTHHVAIPLRGERRFFGALTLAYPEPPRLSAADARALASLGQNASIMLEMLHLQQEMQVHATQNAFIVLVARIISERLDLPTILSITLEQAVSLLNAAGGDIWLLSTDGQWLEPASSLSHCRAVEPLSPGRLPRNRGIRGWVVKHGRPLQLQTPTSDPRFDPQTDRPENLPAPSLLAMPLRHRHTIIGVLTIYHRQNAPFSPRDIELLEGIAGLTASAIINARLMQELRDYADQQRILYEMGREIVAGLDLQTTLGRVLHWAGRLFEVEIGMLWLVEPSTEPNGEPGEILRLATGLGFNLPPKQKITLSPEHSLAGRALRTRKPVVVNNPAQEEAGLDNSMNQWLNISPRNLLAVPMIYHNQPIGVICLLNKIGGDFSETDLTLLSTVIDMVAVAVGNARLHTQTVALMADRERLHKQMLQSERLATVGRLTASLSHEINNPMQAIQGALTLALEELSNPPDLETYIHLSLKESERVVQLVNRLRQIYRPQAEAPELLDLNHLLQEALSIARKELKRSRVTLNLNLAPQLPPITAIAGQLHLVFLSLILDFSDAIAAAGGGELELLSTATASSIHIQLSTSASALTLEDWQHLVHPDVSQQQVSRSLGLSLSNDIIASHGGALQFSGQGPQIMCRIELPLSPPQPRLKKE